MPSIGPIALTAIHQGGNIFAVTVNYTVEFTHWELVNKAQFSEWLLVREQNWDWDKVTFNNPNIGAYGVATKYISDSGGGLDETYESVARTLTATAATMNRSWSEVVAVRRDGTPPNELRALVRLEPHFRSADRISEVVLVSVP